MSNVKYSSAVNKTRNLSITTAEEPLNDKGDENNHRFQSFADVRDGNTVKWEV